MLSNIIQFLSNTFVTKEDFRTNHYLLVHNLSLLLGLVMIYHYIMLAKVIGPALMRNMKPFELRGFMVVYNSIMTLFNLYAFYHSVQHFKYGAVLFDFKYPDIDDVSPEAIQMIHLGYLYWLTKFCDLFDTLFFILRKKYSHITLLHLYHHSVVPFFGHVAFKWNACVPGLLLFSIINSFIHISMYSYYALSALGPQVQKYLWWKKYITVMQLWQFVIYGVYCVPLFIYQTGYPMVWLYVGLTQPPIFFWLFYDFYSKSYKTYKPRIKINDNFYQNGKVK